MKRPSDLRQFFANIAEQLEMDFVYGSTERILNRQSSNLNYPVLWLEKPSMRRQQSAGYRAIFESAFVVLVACRPDDYDEIDTAQDTAWELTEKVINRLAAEHDLLPPTFEFHAERCVSEVVEAWSADADTGWRTEFFITSNFCNSDTFWDAYIWGAGGGSMMGAGGEAVIGHD